MDLKIAPLAEPFEFAGHDAPQLQIILLHGFTASPTEVEPLGKFLFEKSEKKFLIRSILLPGHGIAGRMGFKALDNVSYTDWISDCQSKINKFATDYDCPILIGGLSMGALLTIITLHSSLARDPKFIGGILLSPALIIQSKIFNLVKYIKYIKKYQYKGQESEEFFKEHNLFSYHTRSLHASDEFRKVNKIAKKDLKDVSKPMIAFVAEEDELVNVERTLKLLQENQFIESHKITNMGHIFTVYPESQKIFDEIYQWIQERLEKR